MALRQFNIGLTAIACLLSSTSISAKDVDGDGRGDILWRNGSTGLNWLWTMDGLNIKKSASLNTIPLEWQIAGQGDFDGNGTEDILWRHSESGRNWIYLMDGHTIVESKELNYIADLNWQIKAVLDMNGDGKDDVLWRHAQTGRTWTYLLDGISITASKESQKVQDLGWQIVSSGDVNGDNRDDVIWRHNTTGANYIWLMNGSLISSQYILNTVPLSWDIVGVGDLNGDTTEDIVWRNKDDGRNWAYLMEAGQIATSKQINTIASSDWQIRSMADLNGDNNADIFWRNQQTGQTYIYLMSGVDISQRGWSTTINTDWEVISESTVARIKMVEDDCGDNSSDACSLAINESVAGTINVMNDIDAFKFAIENSGQLKIYSSGNTDVNAELIELTNNTVVGSDDNSGSGTNFSIEVGVQPGEYVVTVSGETGDYSVTTEFEEDKAEDSAQFYSENISQQIVQAKCVTCHTSVGPAAASRLHFERTSVNNYQILNQSAITTYLGLSGINSVYFLNKASGTTAHGGGAQLSPNSQDYQNLKQYLALIE